MPKRISVATHLSIEELEQRYRQAKDGIESRQYQIIWLVAQGKKTAICGGNNWLQQNMDIRIGKKIQRFRGGRVMRCLRRASPTQTVKPR